MAFEESRVKLLNLFVPLDQLLLEVPYDITQVGRLQGANLDLSPEGVDVSARAGELQP